jgi:hypothetical protein
MTVPRFSPMPPTRTEQVLNFLAALGFGLSLLLAYRGLTNHFLVENATLFGKWPLLLLPALGLLVGYLVFWIQKSDWPISLPFAIQASFFEKTQRQVRLLLRLLNAWMQLVLAALLYGYDAQLAPAILLFLMITALLVDLVLLFYFIVRLSRFAHPNGA